MNRFVLLVVGFFLLWSSCKKDDPPVDEEPEIAEGQIILPSELSIDLGTLQVLTPTQTVAVNGSDGTYSVAVPGWYTSQILVDPSGKVLLMGYTYPGQIAESISTVSTAVALVLSMPLTLGLSDEGKKLLIEKMQTEPSFGDLVAEIKNVLVSGRSLFDITNITLVQKIGTAAQDAGLRLSENQSDLPLTVIQEGRNVAFTNTNKAYTTVVGVYRDGALTEQLTVGGITTVPSSISEVNNGSGTLNGDPVQVNYVLEGDAMFKFRLRTGLPGLTDSRPESESAFNLNLSTTCYQIISELLPSLKTTSCADTVAKSIANLIKTELDVDRSNELREIFHLVINPIVDKTAVLVSPCTEEEINSNYFQTMGKFFKLISLPSGATETDITSNVLTVQWNLASTLGDTCFVAMGSLVQTCDSDCAGTLTDLAGNVYQTVEIGGRCWMAENLKVDRFRNGVGIPNITSNYSWLSGAAALCYYDNDSVNRDIYGSIYKWAAVTDPRGLCPTGWSVPTEADWQELIDHLGGALVAGGKMKATGTLETVNGLWITPNLGATNSSGFSALPGGYREGGDYGTFSSMDYNGYWWGIKEASSVGAVRVSLSAFSEQVVLQSVSVYNGYSVRCVEDE